jgi:hypothetical protein
MEAKFLSRTIAAKIAKKAHPNGKIWKCSADHFEYKIPAAKNIESQRSGKCENFVEDNFNRVFLWMPEFFEIVQPKKAIFNRGHDVLNFSHKHTVRNRLQRFDRSLQLSCAKC